MGSLSTCFCKHLVMFSRKVSLSLSLSLFTILLTIKYLSNAKEVKVSWTFFEAPFFAVQTCKRSKF